MMMDDGFNERRERADDNSPFQGLLNNSFIRLCLPAAGSRTFGFAHHSASLSFSCTIDT